ncbi:BZ3500_MvSof-1268-A1-R1_Chr8-1g09875 [Microbotryum saponariae]|uniref:BZ3500_MvSof-1268-A1-R1_Chr8-1g09875 protein n=1 Tax=Microbotryum saponariae TaxID=289078 RepID=A0A2X0KVM4_9BASI|nr:BZ3500_MvSof-1268-A1-R1_Chr8-1g09875 [Microbotryum saponariae]SDA08161.1 BZ3501_MvSof-1269-A2-R1_Chr8-1g09598 [Microbotryum saponariae]
MDREQFRKAGYAAIDWVCDYFENLETLDVMPSVQPGDICKQIPDTAPVEGEAWQDIADDFDKIIMPGLTHWQSPNFYAYFPANTTFESIIADIMVGGVSNPGFNWLCSPACTELEVRMMDWCASLFGLDESFHNSSKEGGGIIHVCFPLPRLMNHSLARRLTLCLCLYPSSQGSASEACLSVCIAARERVMRMHPETKHEDLVIVATTQTHSLGAKAALLLGIQFHPVPTKQENDWAIRGTELREALEALEHDGKVPFIFLATVGSTSTGAIDNISEITATTTELRPRVFVSSCSAAWGGVYLAIPELRAECHLEAINRRSTRGKLAKDICGSGEVHSFCTNLHKSGLVTLDASLLFIRDRRLLTEALDITPPFLRNAESDSGLVVDYRNWQIALGRRFRSLKVWFVLRSYGQKMFQEHLSKGIALAQRLENLVLKHRGNGFELFVPRRFALIVIRLLEPNGGDEETLNKAFFARIAKRKDVHLTPTIVGGKSCTRVAIGGTQTKEQHIDHLWKVIREVSDETRQALEC